MDTERRNRLLWFIGIWAASVAAVTAASTLLRHLVFGLMGAGG
jgi:Protein of unknown function (DUF2474).